MVDFYGSDQAKRKEVILFGGGNFGVSTWASRLTYLGNVFKINS